MVLAYIQICHKLWFQQVGSPAHLSMQMQVPALVELRAIYSCMYIFDKPDTRQHVGAAEEVEIYGVPLSGCGFGWASEGPGEHRQRWDQTSPSSA